VNSNNARFSLRAAVIADAEAIATIVNDAYAKWVPLIGRKPLPMLIDYQQALQDHLHRFTLACCDHDILGLIEMERREDHIFIENIAVSLITQGQGLGKLFLKQAEILASQENVSEIRLLTNGAFTSSITLYERFGYTTYEVGEYLGSKVLHMHKKLGATPTPQP
jgi:N-acetylglutamate synthase-like GNAT family acetyltransferase